MIHQNNLSYLFTVRFKNSNWPEAEFSEKTFSKVLSHSTLQLRSEEYPITFPESRNQESKMSDKSGQVERLQNEITDLQAKIEHKQFKDDRQKREMMADITKKEEEVRLDRISGSGL